MTSQATHLKKILIINIFGVGDVLFSTPMITRLKAQYRDISISYLANKRAAPIITGNPHVDKVFIYERDDFKALYQKSPFLFLKAFRKLIDDLRREKFDAVIDLSLNSSTSFLAWLLGVKHRVGYNYKNRSRLLTDSIDLVGYEGRHVVEYYLELLEKLGVPNDLGFYPQLSLSIGLQDRVWVDRWLAANRIRPEEMLVGMVPGGGASWGANASRKRWSPVKYAKLADKIVEKTNAKVILMGDHGERELCAHVEKLMQHRSFVSCGETSLNQLAALMSKCAFVIVNDGGPLHIAVAAGVKTVSIFGPVDPSVYGPFPRGEHQIVTKGLPCQPCYRRFRMPPCQHLSCLNSLEVEEVLEKVEKFL